MVMALIMMIVRLAITCFTLAVRLALALAALVGKIIGYLIVGIWRAWRNRQDGKVPLRAPKQIESDAPERRTPTSSNVASFTPRPLRPRPKR